MNNQILVAGDVCLDVIGVPVPPPPPSANAPAENWRLTGEMRTHFLPGGAMLLAKFIRAPRMAAPLAKAEEEAQKEIVGKKLKGEEAKKRRIEIRNAARRRHTRGAEGEVIGPRPKKPDGINHPVTGHLYQDDFIEIAERLRRDEIVHSLVSVNVFPTTNDPNEKKTTLRVEKKHGFSGPADLGKNPSLALEYKNAEVKIIVLDDTGNRFRKKDPGNPWPSAIELKKDGSRIRPLIVYKLHHPLPSPACENKLWNAVAKNHRHNRIVIVSVDDLRGAGAPISLGLSWERTALDVVWHLLHFAAFTALRDCRRLVVRLGLDGAVIWHGQDETGRAKPQAFLVYDPCGIEGSFALKVQGEMVSCGSAFTAAFVNRLAKADEVTFSPLVKPVKGSPKKTTAALEKADGLVSAAAEEGLRASRRLLQMGFGDYSSRPNYPGPELFDSGDVGSFCTQPIEIIPGANEPDRSYWRLLDSIFKGKTKLRNAAVNLTATAQKGGANPDEVEALAVLKCVPEANFGALRTYDRCEIEHYRSLHTLLRDYLCARFTSRPLSIGVFGPPGAGKSFGVKEVATSLKGQRDCKETQELTFNLSLYQTPEDLAGAFHLARDVALRGKVPLVFFDEFDTSLSNQPLGWLSHFLAPMQDGEFLDRGAPHPIGPAIFIFAGGTCATYREFGSHSGINNDKFNALKGPDFLSRLRATLDIPSLNFLTACGPTIKDGQRIQPPATFDPYGRADAFPCEAAILLRRASILAFNLPKKGPDLKRADGSLAIKPEVLRALLYLPQFEHGNRSFEALLDMSHLTGALDYTPSLLPAPFQLPLHADTRQLEQLVTTEFPLQPSDRLAIAKAIHKDYQTRKRRAGKSKRNDRSLKDWDAPLDEDLKQSNLEQADDIANKLRAVGLWLRKKPRVSSRVNLSFSKATVARIRALAELLAKAEHDRWAAQKRRQGWIAGPDTSAGSKIDKYKLHNCLFPWELLSKKQQDLDLGPVRSIPQYLAAAGYEVVSNSGP